MKANLESCVSQANLLSWQTWRSSIQGQFLLARPQVSDCKLHQNELRHRCAHINLIAYCHTKRTRPWTSAQNCRNWIVWFQKPDGPILLTSATVGCTITLWWGASSPAKRCLNGEEVWTMITLEVVTVGKRSNWKKNKKNRKLRQKVWKLIIQLIVLMLFTIDRDLCIYR
jgi:hypothetical protein